MTTTTTGTIECLYKTRNPRSRALFEQQKAVLAGGSTHIGRQTEPFPLFIEGGWGARKQDVDGHEYIDYVLGHGAMMLGHAHPTVTRVIAEQAAHGTHGGGETEIASRWAGLIHDMVPSAELVRLVATGGEATQMAIRLARAYTGKDRIVKFQGGFHGWHDAVFVALNPPYERQGSSGVPRVVSEHTVVTPFNDLPALEAALDGDDNIAAVIMEPGGPFNDTVFSNPEFLRGAREMTSSRGVVLIFDEVVTGFRYALGGVQEFFGVTPDLTTLGKIIGGGLPAGAVVGRRDIMELFTAKPEQQFSPTVPHPGTWNAAPIVAAAGVAAFDVMRQTSAVEHALAMTVRLVGGFNSVFRASNVKAFAYARSSLFKVCPGEPPPMVLGDFSSASKDSEQLFAGWGPTASIFRKALLLEGVDLMRTGGFVSAAHTEADIDATCQALERALARLREESFL